MKKRRRKSVKRFLSSFYVSNKLFGNTFMKARLSSPSDYSTTKAISPLRNQLAFSKALFTTTVIAIGTKQAVTM